MVDRTTTVDVLTLEDFQRSLQARLREARAVLDRLTQDLQCRSPALGTFQDGLNTAEQYQSIHQQEANRASRLVSALEAALTATESIIRNYRTTEARNNANSGDIAGVLGGVDSALNGGATNG